MRMIPACTSASLMCQWISLNGPQRLRSQLSNPKQIPSKKGGLTLWQDGHRHLPSYSTTKLPNPVWECPRPPVYFRGWKLSNSSLFCVSSQRCTTEGRCRSNEILWSQLSNRGSHNGSSKRHGGLSYC